MVKGLNYIKWVIFTLDFVTKVKGFFARMWIEE